MRIELSEDEVLFFTELLVVTHLASLRGKLGAKPGTITAITPGLMEDMAKTSVRSLLREALRHPEFRRNFNEYFSNHPSPGIREIGFPWLEEQLTFES